MENGNNMVQNNKKSYIITLLLACLFGGVGAHRFYTGHIFIGILQLLTTGGFGIWVLIDIISLILNKFRDADDMELEGHNVGCAMLVAFTIIITFVLVCIKAIVSALSS